MAKKIKEAKPIIELKDTLYTYWETLPARSKALPAFVLTASIDGVTGTFTSKGRSYRTDMVGLKPVQVAHWMVAVQRCAAGTPDVAVEYLAHNGFTAEVSGFQPAEEKVEEPLIVIMDDEVVEADSEMADE
jgi:hypothetical protein